MTSTDPRAWAKSFAADLTVGGERVPFDRVLRAHMGAVAALKTQGLTWASLARLLERAGVRRPEGRAYSADHLRISFQRLARATAHPREPQRDRHPESRVTATASSSNRAAGRSTETNPNQTAGAARSVRQPLVQIAREGDDTKDISGDEIESVLDRLNRIKP